MCGIVGFLDPRKTATETELRTIIGRQCSTLQHRGPDGDGLWIDAAAGIALGHRRLAVIDLSPEGAQPMASREGRFLLTFNGEIYNFKVLREEIASTCGEAPWRGHSDTEVLLAAIQCFGITATLPRLVGMFALAVWDRQERTLWLARDRLGEKPLFYGWLGPVLVFASELKAIEAHPEFQGEINRDAVACLLTYGAIPAPHAIYRNCHKLPPATLLCVTDRNPRPAPQPYWSLATVAIQGRRHPLIDSDSATVSALEERLRATIRQQMVADVPLGAFLSGGIDSSLVVALMQAEASRPVKSFAIGFHEPGYDEAGYARAVAAHLGCDHTELYVTSREAQEVIPRLPDIYDEPFADSSQIPTCLVAALARQQVTVSLSGDGGDELFGGYHRYQRGSWLWRWLRRIPAFARYGMAAGCRHLPDQAWHRLVAACGPRWPARWRLPELGEKCRRLAELLTLEDRKVFYRHLMIHWRTPPVLGGVEPPDHFTDPWRWPGLNPLVEEMMAVDTVGYLPDDILVKVDRAGMAVSLETRMPFLDHRIVEFAWQLPLSMKFRQGRGKWILRALLDRHLPRSLMDRPKMGFGVPIDHWLRGDLREWADTLLDPHRLQQEGFFDPRPIVRHWQEHLSGDRNHAYWLWDVLMFQAWLARRS